MVLSVSFFCLLHIQIFLADDADRDGEATACGKVLIFCSWFLIVVTMPFSLLVCFKVREKFEKESLKRFFYFLKVVQEYERAVIFRLGRLTKGGAKGPGKCSSHNAVRVNFLFLNFQEYSSFCPVSMHMLELIYERAPTTCHHKN